MDYTERRDLEKGEDDVMKIKRYVQDEHFSHFIILVDDFKNEDQEREYVEETLIFFGNQIKQIMTSTLYLGVLKECTSAYAPTWSSICLVKYQDCHSNSSSKIAELLFGHYVNTLMSL